MYIRDQNKSLAWYTQRAGRIIASVMKFVFATDPGNPAQSVMRIYHLDSGVQLQLGGVSMNLLQELLM